MNDIPVPAILVLTLLLLCAGVFAIVSKRLRFPYTIGLVVVGLGLGALANQTEGLAFIARLHFTPNIVLYLLLPTLVFHAALNIDTRLLLKNLLPVLFLAVPGLVLATLGTGFIVGRFTPLSMGVALLFGGLISATDPVAVIAVFKELGVPRRLTMLVDGESLFNDATAIVMFDIVLALLASGAALGAGTLAGAGVRFLAVFFGGLIVGGGVGFLIVRLLQFAGNDPLIEIAFTAVIAYLAFILAQYYLGLSGVMAVVGAGLVVSYYGATRFTPAMKQQLRHFWEFACFAANSYIFILLGLTEGYLARGADRFYRAGLYVPIAILAVTGVRALLIYLGTPLMNRMSRQRPVDRASQTVMFWGGLRGALPLALAMTLTAEQVGGDANRILLLDCTLGVVLFTLLVQGATLRRLVNRLKLNVPTPLQQALVRNARLSLKRKGRGAIESLARSWPALDPHQAEILKAGYDRAIAELNIAPCAACEAVSSGELWMMALHETDRTFRELFEQGFLRDHTIRELEHFLDLLRDDVLQEILPPRTDRNPGFEARLSAFRLSCARRLAPRAALTRRLQQAADREACSIHLAVSLACEQVHKTLPHLQSLCNCPPEAVRACADWFQDRNTAARARLDRIAREHPGLANDLQAAALRALARQAEAKDLHELLAKGVLSSRLAARVHPRN